MLTNNRTFAGELAHNLSARKRATLVRRAAELNVRLTNGKGKIRLEEKKEWFHLSNIRNTYIKLYK